MIHELLGDKACYSKHSQATIQLFLGAHLLELRGHVCEGALPVRVFARVQPEGIKAEVAGNVLILEIWDPIRCLKRLLTCEFILNLIWYSLFKDL